MIAEYAGERASKEPDSPEHTSTVAHGSKVPVSIIVGATVGGVSAIALLCGALFLLKRHRQRESRARQEPSDVPGGNEEILAVSETSQQPKASMLMDSSVFEMNGNSRASELSSQSPAYTTAELPAK